MTLRCSIPGCSNEAEVVYYGFSWCSEHMDFIYEFPETPVNPGRLYDWAYAMDGAYDELEAQGKRTALHDCKAYLRKQGLWKWGG